MTLTTLAAQSSGHPFDNAIRVPSRDMRSPARPYLPGDWRPATHGASLLTHTTPDLVLKSPARTNISHPVAQPNASGLTVIPLTGCSSQDYFAPMSIGNTSTFQVIVDSGSTSAAVAGKECTECNVSPKYTPGKSATDTGFPIEAQYGSGAWNGEGITDTLQLGTGPKASVTFGDIQTQQAWFMGGDCLSDGNATDRASSQGIMGTGPASLALDGTTSYMDSIASSLTANAYAVSFCDIGGTMWMGGYDQKAVNGSMLKLPMVSSPYYAVDTTSISIGGKDSGVTDSDLGYALVDTGTTQMLLPDSAFQSVVSLIVDASQNHLDTDFFAGFTCIALPSTVTLDDVDAELPPMTLTFGSNVDVGQAGGGGFDPFGDLEAKPINGFFDSPPPPAAPNGNVPIWGNNPPSDSPPSPNSGSGNIGTLTFPATGSYLMPMIDSKGRTNVCPGLGSASQLDITILGNTLMHNNVVVFDVDGQQILWGQGKNVCA